MTCPGSNGKQVAERRLELGQQSTVPGTKQLGNPTKSLLLLSGLLSVSLHVMLTDGQGILSCRREGRTRVFQGDGTPQACAYTCVA